MLALVGGHAALTGGLGISSSLCALQNACSARWWAIFDAGTLLFGWLVRTNALCPRACLVCSLTA